MPLKNVINQISHETFEGSLCILDIAFADNYHTDGIMRQGLFFHQQKRHGIFRNSLETA